MLVEHKEKNVDRLTLSSSKDRHKTTFILKTSRQKFSEVLHFNTNLPKPEISICFLVYMGFIPRVLYKNGVRFLDLTFKFLVKLKK